MLDRHDQRRRGPAPRAVDVDAFRSACRTTLERAREMQEEARRTRQRDRAVRADNARLVQELRVLRREVFPDR